jgi:hypothetical protein
LGWPIPGCIAGTGDTIVVPEKALGGGPQWQTILATAQAAAAISSTIFIALQY